MTDLSSHLAVGAIVSRGSDILLVSEPDEDNPGELIWALPGGNVIAPETVGEALRRRVAEEAGLVRVHAGRLLWVTRYAVRGQQFESLVFEVLEASPYKSKGLTRDALKPPASWVPHDEAVERLAKMWFAPIRDPAVAYLTGRAPVATLWTWSRLDGPPETVPSAGVGGPVAADGERDEDGEDEQRPAE
ncbi:MAG TPA: NUDIX hydrolase [Candidatus Saccharimonadia bacterium]|nr:NUDIX hydrolase [Candidatus Saccharimonadia bacterium]